MTEENFLPGFKSLCVVPYFFIFILLLYSTWLKFVLYIYCRDDIPKAGK